MKNLLLLLLCVPLMFSCGENEKNDNTENTEKNWWDIERVEADKLDEIDEIVYYKEEPFNGISFKEYENGKLEKEINYRDGRRDGLLRFWHENGNLHSEINYQAGKIIIQRLYWKDGRLHSYITYNDNIMHGRHYINNGKRTEVIWEDLKIVSKKCWDESGNEIDCIEW
ncbi:hypothetical protein OAJ56_02080 [Flavobacteriales bacterium]|nr:hypothetical protein [Flavobacteriales bacterium]